ncbi:MAG TPA: PAS domain S-box protein [Methanoregula sp.]|nr:PAS domain S-box protein [Methanoregula sp.]
MAKETSGNDKKNGIADLRHRIDELTERNRELEETLDAIRSGEVDAIVVSKGDGQKIYTLEGPDQPYRVLVENIREGALTLSRTGMILYANTRFAEMVKEPAEKVVGTFILDYICPEYRDEITVALREITKKACRSRVRIRHGEKGSLPVMISMNPLDGGIDSKISVVITDRRKDEDRIQMQARMLDAVGDAVIAADTHNKIIYWNNAATKTYGWTPEEAIGRDLVEVATPEISQKQAREIAARIAKGETWTGEYIVKHRDGHEFPIYANDAPVFDDDGRLVAIIGASHDITGRKRAEDEIRVSEEKFRLISTNSPDSMSIQDRDLRYEWVVNPAFAFTPEYMIGKTDQDLLNPEQYAKVKALKEKVMNSGKEMHLEIPLTDSKGKTFVYDGAYIPRRDVHGKVVGILCYFKDITERKLAEDELKKKHNDLNAAYEEIISTQEELRQNVEELTSRENQLSQALAEKEILLSEIHHRVKNNLTAFISLLSLEGSYEESPAGKALKKDLQNRARTMALIHETLYKTRQYSDVDMDVYLSTLLEQVVGSYSSAKMVKTVVEARGVTLDLARATPIGLIVNELVTNSLKYAFTKDAIASLKTRKEPCTIAIRLVKENDAYLMRVSDNGAGLPAGLNLRTTQTLGLKLVNFLAQHQLRAKPEVLTDRGTEFVFRFRE